MATAPASSTSPTAPAGALDIPLDVFGQSAFLQIYTQLCLAYPVADPASHSSIISTLQKGLERLCESFPWLAGQVVNEGANGEDTGVYKIKSFQRSAPLAVKDLSNDPSISTMDALRKANFPMSMLDESIIAPRRTLPGHPDEARLNSPVLSLQATFINGGLLLTFASQHATMDMTGQGQLMSLLERACRGEPFTDEELRIGNIDRQNLIPLLDNYQPGPEISHLMIKPPSAKGDSSDLPHTQKLPAPSSWAHISFSSESLAALKSLAERTKPSSTPFISTDDALSALIWQTVARARLLRLTPSTNSTFGRALDGRPYMDNIPNTYPGLMQSMCFNKATLQYLATSPLGIVASDLRTTLHPSVSKTEHIIRATATVLSASPNKNIIGPTATIDTSTDITVSSWSRVNAYDLDFSLGLGKPEAIRRPRFTPVEGLIYFMPRGLDGNVGVAVCLRDEDLERVKGDSKLGRFGVFVG
ncbi:transferase family-domain-containing protein [Aspergillus venezuelensis]